MEPQGVGGMARRKQACLNHLAIEAPTFLVFLFIKRPQAAISFIFERDGALNRLTTRRDKHTTLKFVSKTSIRGRCDLFRDFQGDSKALRLWTRPGKTISYSGSNATAGFKFGIRGTLKYFIDLEHIKG